MKTKLIILFIFTTFFGFSQDLESMKKEVQKIYDLTIEKKFEAVIESTYPKVFEISPKKDMVQAMNQVFDNEEVKVTLEKVNPDFTFSEIKIINGGKYCVVEYNNKMTMKFKEELGEGKNFILNELKKAMIGYTVTIDEKTEVFTVDGRAKMIAISDQLTKGTWKYLNYNAESPMMEQVLGKAILEKLGL